MKVIRNGICFVELEDLEYKKELPTVVNKERKKEVFYSAYIHFEKFKGEDSVRYFEEQEDILDYDQLCLMSEEQLNMKIIFLKSYLFSLEHTLASLFYGVVDMDLRVSMIKEKNINLAIQKTLHTLKQLVEFKEKRSLYDREIQNLYFENENTRKR